MLSKYRVFATLPFDGLEKAEEFYSNKLGLKRRSGSVQHGFLEYEAAGGTVLQIFESDSDKSDDTAATFVVEDLAREMAELRAKGVKFEEYDLPGVKTKDGVATMGKSKGAWIKDPGGNVIALHQD
jgi:catechol 2,3-dioxygenase-like lactoylglutathione lyase family enzyme